MGWDDVRAALLCIATCAGLIAIVPLMVWGGSGDWRAALRALREYVSIGVFAVIVVGLLAASAIFAEFIDR